MRNRWFHRPLFHVGNTGTEKRATWLELFYDLIFVAAFIQLGNGLAKHLSVGGFFAFAGVFTTLWVAWAGVTFYMNRYTIDDFVHRILIFLQMSAVGAMAVFSPGVLDGKPEPFAISYAIAQGLIAILYLRSWSQQVIGRSYCQYWGGTFMIGSLIWVLSPLFSSPWIYILWAIGVLSILIAPLSSQSRQLADQYPIDMEHLGERFGLLTIIVLGESFVKTLSVATMAATSFQSLVSALFPLIITCSVWWIYFDDVAGSDLKPGSISWVSWLYAHLPLPIGITALGVALKKAAVLDFSIATPEKMGWLLAGSLSMIYISVAVIDAVTERKQAELSDHVQVYTRFTSGIVLMLLAGAAPTLSAAWFVGIVVGISVIQVGVDMVFAPFDHTHHEETVTTAEIAKQKLAGTRHKEHIHQQVGSAIRKGTPSAFRKDLYFFLMEGSWARVSAAVVLAFIVANLIFAALFVLQPGSIDTARPHSFSDAFFFSVQTMSTIGYGNMSPATPYGNMIVTIEAMVGIVGMALVTGLMFAKASQARSSIMFSKPVIITQVHGHPTLMFRAGNARGNDVVDATIDVSVMIDDISPEGHHIRKVTDLKLKRNRTPFFSLTWTVMHVIDKDSPIYDIDWKTPDQNIIAIVVTLTGHDGTYGQTIYARHYYYPEDILQDRKFVDVISQMTDGRLMIDYAKFDETVPAEG